VFDTNVFCSALLSRTKDSASVTVVKLWMVLRYLELVVCDEVVAEYLDVFSRLQIDLPLIESLEERIQAAETVTWVNLGPRVVASRDRDDDVFLSTAKPVGRGSW
jgi:predicted nucleic acid-binding protein